VKHIVNFHRWRKCMLHGHRTNLLQDFEGSISFWGKFAIAGNGEVVTFEPDLVTFFNLR